MASDISVSGGLLSDFNRSGNIYNAIFTAGEPESKTANIIVSSEAFSDNKGNLNKLSDYASILIEPSHNYIRGDHF